MNFFNTQHHDHYDNLENSLTQTKAILVMGQNHTVSILKNHLYLNSFINIVISITFLYGMFALSWVKYDNQQFKSLGLIFAKNSQNEITFIGVQFEQFIGFFVFLLFSVSVVIQWIHIWQQIYWNFQIPQNSKEEDKLFNFVTLFVWVFYINLFSILSWISIIYLFLQGKQVHLLFDFYIVIAAFILWLLNQYYFYLVKSKLRNKFEIIKLLDANM